MAILAVAPNRTFCRNVGTPAADVSITDTYAQIDMVSATGAGVALDVPAQNKLWVHAIYRPTASGTSIRIMNGATQVFAFGSSTSQAQVTLEGSSFTNLFALPASTEVTLDVLLDLSAGRAEVYVNGSLAWSTNRSFTATTVNEVQVLTMASGARFREIIVADEPTIAMRLDVRTLTGAGASQDQVSGTFADIDDQTPDQGTGIVLDTNDRALFTVDAPATIPGGLVRRAVVVAAEARRGATGPTNLRLTTRTGSTNTDSPTRGLSEAYAKYQHVFEGASDPSQIGVVAEA